MQQTDRLQNKPQPLKLLLRLRLLLLLVWLGQRQAFAQQVPDTLGQKSPWYQSRPFKTVAAPTLLIGYGVVNIGERDWGLSSREARLALQRRFMGFHSHVDDFLAFSPALTVYGLNLAGVQDSHGLRDRTFLYLISYGTMITTVTGLKLLTHQQRPDNSTFNSFPSAHTATAFAAAEFMHQEFRDKSVWYSVTGYTLASATGVLRMLNDRHWLSDVFVGAGVGMLSTKLTYLLYPRIQKRIGRDNKIGKLRVAPSFYGGATGVLLVYSIR